MIQAYDILVLTGAFTIGMIVGGAGVGYIVYQWLTNDWEQIN